MCEGYTLACVAMYHTLFSGRLLGQVLSIGVCGQFSVRYSYTAFIQEHELRVGWFFISYGSLPF